MRDALASGQPLRRYADHPADWRAGVHLEWDLKHALNCGELEAAGVLVGTEKLLFIPLFAWSARIRRVGFASFDEEEISQFDSAVRGLSIQMSAAGPEVRPCIAQHALMKWMGAEVLPPQPELIAQPWEQMLGRAPVIEGVMEEPSLTSPKAERKQLPSLEKGGRPSLPEQDLFIQELIRYADQLGLPDKRTELTKHMIEWCGQTFGDKAPSETTIRSWLKKYLPPQAP